MKRLVLIVAMVLFLTAPVMAVEFHPSGSTIAYDAVTKDINGNPLFDPIRYNVYIKERITDVKTFLGATDELTFVAVLPVAGVYYPGVSSMTVIDGVPIPETESDITWGDSEDVAAVPVPFGLASWLKLQSPKGLRLVK